VAPPPGTPRIDAVDLLAQVTAAIPGGEDRPSQVQMTQAVQTAFRTRRHLAVQGPTGVGKSLAYLLPAIAAAGPDDRTVVVTSSKALQDQLCDVDLPFLAATLDRPFSYAVLKGRSNYLCAAALDEVQVQLRGGAEQQHLELGADAAAATGPDLSDEAVLAEVEHLIEWSEHTVRGDIAELDEAPHWQAWAAVSVGPGECVGAANCSFAEECWSEAARTAAETADIVVVNAHLYGAHVQTGRTLLPEHTRLVIDEAHEFEDSIVGSLSVEMTEGRLANLARVHERCIADEAKVGTSLRSAGQMLEALLTGASADASGPSSQVRLRDGLGKELAAVVATVASAADRALNSLRRAAKLAGQSSARHRLDRAVRVAEGVLGDAQSLLGSQGPGTVCWIESTRSGRHALRLTRIDIAATLRARAWEDSGLTVVCCSATLDRGTARRLGLDAEYLAVDSPFDFAEQAVLYVPKLVRPNHPDWPEQVAACITHLIERLDGRTLALFTSNRMLRETVERCREALPDRVILAQGDAPNPVLQRQFLAEEHTCLFATASFWTGISSPGTTCSAVVLDKIPFPVPSDPIVEARSELVGDQRAFMEVSVPAAGMQLAQGVGRLIRTASDRGVVTVCDPRLAEARYREQILGLLPPMRRVRNADFVDRFIDSLELPRSDASPAEATA
jgi:ATP-dependent DNA helicase DinG